MKTQKPCRSYIHLNTCLALLATCLAASLAAAPAAQPSLQPLLQGKWPDWTQGGNAQDVKVVGNYAYVALGKAG